MQLKEWLTEKGMVPAEFAKLICRTPEAVRRYIAGDRIPDRKTMDLIVKATGTRVTANDFFGIEQASDVTENVILDGISRPLNHTNERDTKVKSSGKSDIISGARLASNGLVI